MEVRHVDVLYDKVREVIKKNESRIQWELDEEIRNWVDEDDMGEYEDEIDYYYEYSNGEAGDVVFKDVIEPILKEHMTEDEYKTLEHSEICEIINEEVGGSEYGR